QAGKRFPFLLLGIDTDSGSEFLNEELIAYCEQEHLTFYARATGGQERSMPCRAEEWSRGARGGRPCTARGSTGLPPTPRGLPGAAARRQLLSALPQAPGQSSQRRAGASRV